MRKAYQNLRNSNTFLPSRLGLLFNQAYLIRRTLAEEIRNEASNVSGTLLDFGCGSKPYRSLFEVERYIGLDIEVSGHPTQFKSADIYYDGKSIPLDDCSVDHVFSAEVFEHVFNAPELFGEIYRILKPGGTLILTCPFVWPLHEEPYDFARYTPYALEALLKQAGFNAVSTKRCGHDAEVICQMTLGYLARRISPIPIFKTVILTAICGFLNITGRCLAKVLPSERKLYLSNFAVATKALNG